MSEITKKEPNIEELFKIGAHFGFSKSRRHPSASQYIFGSKNRVDLFDLEKTLSALQKALDFVKKLAEEKGVLLLVGGKSEAQKIIRSTAEAVNMPYVAGRWIGGTLTNFGEIRKRVETMIDLENQKEKGELGKYTKKERLLIDRKIEKLEKMFGGIRNMTNMPKAIFIVDPRYEKTALSEAKTMKIPVIALCGSDNDMSQLDYVIPANDANIASIKYFTGKIGEAYKN